MKRYDQKAYKLPPPTLAHVPSETNKRLLEEQPGPSSKRNRVFITPIIRPSIPPVQIPDPPVQISATPELTTPHVQIPATPELTTPPVQIPDPPAQILDPPVQIQVTPEPTTPQPPEQLFLPDPPQPPVQILLPDSPVFETLEPTLTDDSSIDQIMSSVFGDCSQQEIQVTPAHTQEPQVLDSVPSLFDESNDLISFLDHFETGLAIEQQETPMDLTMPRLKKKVKRATGFKVVKLLELFVHIVWKNGECVYESFGSDVGQRGRVEILPSESSPVSPSLGCISTSKYGCVYFGFYRLHSSRRRVREMVDVVGRLGNALRPWRMVDLQPWKWAMEKDVQHSPEKALANGMSSDVTLLEHI
ncbi:hypothetical protein TNCV_4652401 [Trichonephila clavipes]|nr:hypothetical protein TNCV_4652401 [Trichonephila clavipes]